jgi:hypothetical protein
MLAGASVADGISASKNNNYQGSESKLKRSPKGHRR